MASCQDRVLSLLLQQNKPFNTQAVADMLAQHGLKKAQVQRSLDELVERGKITVKDFGKARIYFPLQSTLPVLSKEELAARQQKSKELLTKVKEEEEATTRLEKELAALRSSLTLQEIQVNSEGLQKKVQEVEVQLASLRKENVQISKKEREQVQEEFAVCMDQWRKRRAIFKQIWDTISENSPHNKTDLFEELGIETDEQVGYSIHEFSSLLPKRRRI